MDNIKVINKIIKCIDKIIDFTKGIDYDGVNINIAWDTIKKECSLYYSVAYL